MLKIGSIVMNVYSYEATIVFYKEALHLEVRPGSESEDFVVLFDPTGLNPNMSFQKREKPRPSRSWIHLDFYSDDQDGEVERLIQLGAKRYAWRYPVGADYVVLEDPDANLFCVVQK
jgi:catechol 2,3-dioxygenase-like lactoylglutathione lyase family enzyme